MCGYLRVLSNSPGGADDMSVSIVSTPVVDPRAHGWRCAILGASLWCAAFLFLPEGTLPQRFVLLSPLLLCPLILCLLAPRHRTQRETQLWHAAMWLQLPAALPLLVSFTMPPGIDAALWA